MKVIGKATTAYSSGLIVTAGQTVYIWCQVPLDADGKVLAENDIESQA